MDQGLVFLCVVLHSCTRLCCGILVLYSVVDYLCFALDIWCELLLDCLC